MVCAVGSRSSLSYIEETTFGTTPVGNFTELPYNTHSLDLTKERVAGNQIRKDRLPVTDRHGNKQVAGDIVADLANAEFDPFLESALLGSFTSDVLDVGTTPKFFSIEDYASDIDQSRVFSGCTVSTMAISLAPNQMVTTTFTMVGKDMIQSATEKTITASAAEVPFDSYSGDILIGDAEGVLSAIGTVTQLDFTVNNGFTPSFVVGSDSVACMPYGMAVIEGTLTCHYEDDSLINRFLNEVETALSVSVNDPSGANAYTFFFPRIKLNGATVPVGGPEIRLIEIPFVALGDISEGTNLRITRPTVLP